MKRFNLVGSSQLLALCACMSVVLTPSVPVHAQQMTAAAGIVTGMVTDPRGNVVPNATVAIKNDNSGLTTRVTTDQSGRYTKSGLTAGKYTIEFASPGFALSVKTIVVAAQQTQDVSAMLSLGGATDTVTVEAAGSGSSAAQYAPLDGLLEARSARTEISSMFIQNFVSPVADFSEIVETAPGTVSVNPNGVGLGDGKVFFRGFKDGQYDVTFDGIPYNDTNDPSHHSWAFFPSQFIGGVDFDRSPGSASTIGPAPYGGSINLLSRDVAPQMNLRGGVTYGSFNTILADGQFDSGRFGGATKKSALTLDVHRLTSDGFQTYNAQERVGGDIKYQYQVSPKTTLTGFAAVLRLKTNTPDAKAPTRLQVFGDGTAANPGQYNFLLNNDPTSPYYVGYNNYVLPTDFEYIGYKSELGKGWALESKPYTYSYNNRQNIAVQNFDKTGVIIPVSTTSCTPVANSSKVLVTPCGIDKLNSYRKYGANTLATQTSRFGIFRTGLWYEWARTDRSQTPYSVLTRAHDSLANFHEMFWTNSYQPYAEFEYHATTKLTLTGGFKLAAYTQDLKQYADNGKTVGLLAGASYQRNYASYISPLPSADVNYRLRSNWSAYGQFATGSVIPPSSVYDVSVSATNPNPVSTLPKPTLARTFQTGTVVKLKRVTINADGYYTHFENSYTADPNTTSTTGINYQTSGSIVSKGLEAEANFYLTHGLSLYTNGTVGSARYISASIPGASGVLALNPNYQMQVAGTPSNTEAIGMTYQQKYFDIGLFHKRVGTLWNDSSAASTGVVYQGQTLKVKTLSQVIPISPFNITNLFFNYTVRNGSHFDQTKLRLSFNNLLDTRNIVGVSQAAKANAYTPGNADTLSLTPSRSVSFTVTFGYSPKR